MLSARVFCEADCLLYPTLILQFFHSVGKYSRSSETVRQGLLTQGLRSQEKKGKTFQTINNVNKICVRLTNSGSTAKGTVIKGKIARRSNFRVIFRLPGLPSVDDFRLLCTYYRITSSINSHQYQRTLSSVSSSTWLICRLLRGGQRPLAATLGF